LTALEMISAADSIPHYAEDETLPDMAAVDELVVHQDQIPRDFRVYDLVFPKAIEPGLVVGRSRISDPSIACLIWNGSYWEKHLLLAGRYGLGFMGQPHIFGPRSRLVRFGD